VWERATTTNRPQDFDTYETICRVSYQNADGVTIWGGGHALDGKPGTQTWAADTATTAQGAWWNKLWGPMAASGRYWG